MRNMPIRLLALGALSLTLAACASGGGRDGPRHFMLERGKERGDIRRGADPGKVVAAEIAFARLAQEKGQWTAFAEYATKDAVMFVPQAVNAQEWLKRQTNPARSVEWEPYQVWSSCDGSLAATQGPWTRPDGSVGYFTTIWQRQRDGAYKWVMDQGDTLSKPIEEPEMVQAEVADCAQPALPPPVAVDSEGTSSSGVSRDGTLRWAVNVGKDQSRSVNVFYWNGTDWARPIDERVAAP